MKNDITNLKTKGVSGKPVLVKSSEEFDFDYWANLSKKDPEAFEKARKTRIEKHISGIQDDAAQDRMRKLQWRVEMERRLSKNPMDAAVRLYDMMWESVGNNMDAMHDLIELLDPKKSIKPVPKPNAKILSFYKEEIAEID